MRGPPLLSAGLNSLKAHWFRAERLLHRTRVHRGPAEEPAADRISYD